MLPINLIIIKLNNWQMYSGPYSSEFKINKRQHDLKDEIRNVTVEIKRSEESTLPSFGKNLKIMIF